MISHTKIQEIKHSIESIGETKTRKQLKLSKETFNRYKRLIREHNSPSTAKILIFDIETLYMVGAFWRPWKTDIHPNQVFKPTCLLSWSAKWLNNNEVMSDILTPKEAVKRDERRVATSLWKLFDEADIVIAHNGKAFDIKRMNTVFITNGLLPPSPYQVIDTKYIAKKEFGFDYNSLEWLAIALKLPVKKQNTSFSWWIECEKGNKEYLDKMVKYNQYDVLVLEEVYCALRPFIKSHPNMNLFTEKDVCSACGSENIKKKGSYKTSVNSYNTMVCGDCGAYSRQAKNKLVSVAR